MPNKHYYLNKFGLIIYSTMRVKSYMLINYQMSIHIQSHIYPLNSVCLSISTFTLTSRWNCTKPLLGEYSGVYCLLYILMKVYHLHYDVIVRKYFSITGPLWGRLPVDPPLKDQWCETLMFPLVSVWTNFWTNSTWAGDLICIEAYLTLL